MSNPLILGTNSIKDTGYEVANSVLFDDGSSNYLTRTPSSAGNRKTFTFSFWIKRSNISTDQLLFSAGTYASTVFSQIYLSSGDQIFFQGYDNSGNQNASLNNSDMLFRDVSAWYHIVVAVDTTQATDSNRVKFYINGSQITFGTNNYPSQNYDYAFNNNDIHNIGRSVGGGASYFFNGYIAEFCMIDGQQLDPTSFGEFDSDTNIWKPIDVSGLTFGTNGFYLDFENASNLGADVSGNGNNFTVNNLTSIDQTTDTCTNNFATFNPLDKTGTGAPTGSEGNLKLTGDASTNNTWNSTIGLSAGKWYAEMKVLASDPDASLGFRSQTNTSGSHNNLYGFNLIPDKKLINGGNTGSAIGSTSQNDILGIALDLDNGKLFIHRNGTYLESGDPANGTNPFIQTSDGLPSEGVIGGHIYNGSVEWNFGGTQTYTISSGNSDGNGYGNFEHSVPSGYYSICTKNLAEYG